MAESDDDMLARLSRKSDAAASSSSSSSSSSSGAALSARAAAVYDRSIRVYGVETQQALSASRVLVAGLASGMGAEAAKTLMLAGMSVTLADARPAQGRHLASNFLLSAAELAAAAAAAAPPPSLAAASLARLAELNPLAEARAVGEDLRAATGHARGKGVVADTPGSAMRPLSARAQRSQGQSPNIFCLSSRRCCASRDKLAVGRAIKRPTPMASPVSSQ